MLDQVNNKIRGKVRDGIFQADLIAGAALLAAAILVGSFVYSHFFRSGAAPAPTVEDPAAQETRWQEVKAAELRSIESAVQASLKDPSSAVFRDVLVQGGLGIACGEVNARNGFGGDSGFTDFFVFFDPIKIDRPGGIETKVTIRKPGYTDRDWGYVAPKDCLNYWGRTRSTEWWKRTHGL